MITFAADCTFYWAELDEDTGYMIRLHKVLDAPYGQNCGGNCTEKYGSEDRYTERPWRYGRCRRGVCQCRDIHFPRK